MNTETVFDLHQAEQAFNAMQADWQKTLHYRSFGWQKIFDDMLAEQQRLQKEGKWVTGPADLLSVVGRSRRENFHSDVLAWLLNPCRPHGLGTRFLEGFIKDCWQEGPSLHPDQLAFVTVRREDYRNLIFDGGATRSDIVVTGKTFTLVIEVKIDAPEGKEQCERLYQEYRKESTDVRFAFLTPMGKPPITAYSRDAREAFKPISFPWVRQLLVSVTEHFVGHGRDSVLSYLETLHREFL